MLNERNDYGERSACGNVVSYLISQMGDGKDGEKVDFPHYLVNCTENRLTFLYMKHFPIAFKSIKNRYCFLLSTIPKSRCITRVSALKNPATPCNGFCGGFNIVSPPPLTPAPLV